MKRIESWNGDARLIKCSENIYYFYDFNLNY